MVTIVPRPEMVGNPLGNHVQQHASVHPGTGRTVRIKSKGTVSDLVAEQRR
jgi:hypothetical protein